MYSYEYRAEKRLVKVEFLRRRFRNKIIEDFSEEITKKGGFTGNSKTAKKCRQGTVQDGIKAFMNRWFLIQKLKGVLCCFQLSFQANQEDPIIPSNPENDEWLIRELKEGGFNETDSSELQDKLKQICKENSDAYKEEVAKIPESSQTISITVTEESQFTEFCDEESHSKIRIREPSLKDLYKQYKGQKDGNEDNMENKEFLQSVYLLLFRWHFCDSLICRYDTTDGDAPGNQMALPFEVFDYLKDTFGLQCECFASPFNRDSKIETYCSQFIDTDKPFGSLGNFFEYFPEEGVFECNPPFVEECMIQNIDHVSECLKRAESAHKALTFFIIVPAWKDDCESYEKTHNNEFFVLEIEMVKKEHFYRNGMMHSSDYALMNANANSLMLVLQTTKAKSENKIDKEKFEREIKERWGIRKSKVETNPRNSTKRKRRYYSEEYYVKRNKST